MTEFTAHAVGVVEPREFEADVLVIAERSDGSGRGLEVQGSTTAQTTEQDRRLGFDTYCLVNENQATVYGGVERWSCDHARVCISLNPEASEALGAADGYTIRVPDRKTSPSRGPCWSGFWAAETHAPKKARLVRLPECSRTSHGVGVTGGSGV